MCFHSKRPLPVKRTQLVVDLAWLILSNLTVPQMKEYYTHEGLFTFTCLATRGTWYTLWPNWSYLPRLACLNGPKAVTQSKKFNSLICCDKLTQVAFNVLQFSIFPAQKFNQFDGPILITSRNASAATMKSNLPEVLVFLHSFSPCYVICSLATSLRQCLLDDWS